MTQFVATRTPVIVRRVSLRTEWLLANPTTYPRRPFLFRDSRRQKKNKKTKNTNKKEKNKKKQKKGSQVNNNENKSAEVKGHRQ
ncbi:hypothetical protein E2C01_064214 [Portunus trituberculatus]|uniref:Uncharacterized protein n=1 Tax=Portunus trituberculatus TaxID=210409 RepID=A0A5B7HB44_PORTR|nr:hypothetical protein [Portunus trituberculatus]